METLVYYRYDQTFVFRWMPGDEEHVINDWLDKAARSIFSWHDATACSYQLGVWLSERKRKQLHSAEVPG